MWTVWEFKSVDGRQVVRVIRTAQPDDLRYQSEYQRIVYRGADHEAAKSHA